MLRLRGTEPTIPIAMVFERAFLGDYSNVECGCPLDMKYIEKPSNSHSDCGGVLSPLVLTGSVRPCVVRRGCLSEVYR